MPKYSAYVIVDAGFPLETEFEADTPEAALDLAMASEKYTEAGYQLCHQCSRRLEVGDPVKILITNDEDNSDTTFDI